MNDPTCFVNMQEYYYFIYAVSYMMIAEMVIWLYNFKSWIKNLKYQIRIAELYFL